MHLKSNISGIYKITCLVNSGTYFGSSINVKSRLNKHLLDLKNGKHHIKKLQRDFNKFGIDNFKFDLLKEVPEEDLLSSEQLFIDKGKLSGVLLYNVNSIASRPMSKTKKEHNYRKFRSRGINSYQASILSQVYSVARSNNIDSTLLKREIELYRSKFYMLHKISGVLSPLAFIFSILWVIYATATRVDELDMLIYAAPGLGLLILFNIFIAYVSSRGKASNLIRKKILG